MVYLSKVKILLIEDDRSIAHSLKQGLRNEYLVKAVCSGKKGLLEAFTHEFDLIILDLNLPDMNGLEICQNLRRQEMTVPILILTAEDKTTNKIILLNAGADDYLIKPFSLGELKARLKALSRRGANLIQKIITHHHLSLNQDTKTVFFHQKLLKLTNKEFLLLKYFMLHPKRIFTRLQLTEHLWEGEDYLQSNTIDVHLYNLRQKLAKISPQKLIKTIHGSGYIFDPQ